MAQSSDGVQDLPMAHKSDLATPVKPSPLSDVNSAEVDLEAACDSACLAHENEPVEPHSPTREVASRNNMKAHTLGAAEGEAAECPICFAPLPDEPVCVLIRRVYTTKRSCRHYFHHGCIQLLKRQTPSPHMCPLCREQFETVEALPDVRLNSRAWFKIVDYDQRGSLEKSEVVDALSATLPVDPELLRQSLDGELWDQWDTDHNGTISLENFERPGKGLLHFVLYSMPSLQRESGQSISAAVPDIVDSREGWFRYWDENSRQMLEFLQLLRALVRSLRLDGAKEDAGILRSVLSGVWQEFGLTESNQEIYKPVSLALFCERPDGFCDALVDALQKKFGRAKFRRIRERAHLLQQPAAVLKKELRKLNCNRPDLIEKDELVSAILDAQELGLEASSPDTAGITRSPSPCSPSSPMAQPSTIGKRSRPEGLKVLSLKQVQHRLQAYGVAYGHCLERADLEDLLIAQGDTGVEELPERPPTPKVVPSAARPTSAGSASNGNSRNGSAAGQTNGMNFSTPHSVPSAAPWPQTMGAGSARVHTNQPIPTVIEPPDKEEGPLKKCMQSCEVQ